ncbi:MAG: D-aminoacyl-tRNA deacylase [Sulfolobales archaeon]
MKFGLIYSLNDMAGVGIAETLRSLTSSEYVRLSGFNESYIINDLDAILVGINCDITECEFLDELLDVEYYVMISKHYSNMGVKSFTTHHVGIPIHDLSIIRSIKGFPSSNPGLAKLFLNNLTKFSIEYGLNDFVVSYEVTHHGPYTLKRPTTFIELGSSANEWGLKKAQEVMAYAIINSLNLSGDCVSTVGFGGNHYANLFTSRALRSDECYGHIVPNYVLKYFKDDVDVLSRLIDFAIRDTYSATSRVVLDSKVPSIVKRLVKDYCSKLGLEIY